MAIALRGTVGSATGGSVTNVSLTLTKPTGVVDGDLLYIFLQYSRTDLTVTPPAGWTLVDSDTATIGAYLYRRTASSEPSTYEFTAPVLGNTAGLGLIWAHYDTAGAGNPKQDVITEVVDGSADTTADNTGVTPTCAPGSMLVAVIGTPGVATSYSGYAVANNNPTWSEGADTNHNFGGDTVSAAMAYATGRDLITATGAFSATIANSATTAVYLMNIQPAGFSLAAPLMTLALGPLAPAISLAATVAPPVMNLSLSMPAASVATSDPDWTNTTKSGDLTITNISKS